MIESSALSKPLEPLVSVIVPTRNRPTLFMRAVESVLTQTYSTIECLIVDDASDTPYLREFESMTGDNRVRSFWHRTRRGAAAARNTGIAQARGDMIAFLDDDDQWLATKLAKQVELLGNLPGDYGMVYCWMDYFDSSGSRLIEHHPTFQGEIFPYVLDSQRIGGCPTLLVRREVIDDVGGFDDALPRGNDGDFIRRVALGYLVDYVPEVLVKVFVDHGHERISQQDEAGLLNAIKGEQAKLQKFDHVLTNYPTQTARVHSKIGVHYARLRLWKDSAYSFARAGRIKPLSSSLLKDLGRAVLAAFASPKKI